MSYTSGEQNRPRGCLRAWLTSSARRLARIRAHADPPRPARVVPGRIRLNLCLEGSTSRMMNVEASRLRRLRAEDTELLVVLPEDECTWTFAFFGTDGGDLEGSAFSLAMRSRRASSSGEISPEAPMSEPSGAKITCSPGIQGIASP